MNCRNKAAIADMEKEEEIKIPVWILEEIDDALRLTAKIYKCSERNTCWQRDIMQAYNMTRQLLETGRYEYSVSHRMRVGQTPNKEDYKNQKKLTNEKYIN